MRLLEGVQLAGEEIVEIDELRVAVDDLVGLLFERQPDIEAEAILPARAALGSTHDSIAAAGNGHVAEFLVHAAGELAGSPALPRRALFPARPQTPHTAALRSQPETPHAR